MNQDNSNKGNDGGVEVNIPANVSILYTDSVYIHSNQFGVVFDFAQNVGPTNKQNIVARVGMSKEHAKVMLKVLKDNLEASEEAVKPKARA